MDRAVILGSSRGLGAELAKKACAATYSVTGIARKEASLKLIQQQYPLFEFKTADLAKPEGQDSVIRYLLEETFSKVFCVAGGGPYAPFGHANWKDHDWAWEVSFRAHARVLHAMAQAHRFEQVILIGSSVAESEGDKGAASYAAAKHALKGLHSSLRLDYPDWDVRLYSPGYMDTPLLPLNAGVRKGGVYDPIDVANDLWIWSLSADNGGHKVYPKHPL
jgi:NAD(P)-dependent dehydrogenase (short-subunit alcohol dehydrogenase family)